LILMNFYGVKGIYSRLKTNSFIVKIFYNIF